MRRGTDGNREDDKVWSGKRWGQVSFWVCGMNAKESITRGKEAGRIKALRAIDQRERLRTCEELKAEQHKYGEKSPPRLQQTSMCAWWVQQSVHQKTGREKNKSEIPSGTSWQAATETVFVFSSLEENKWLWGHIWWHFSNFSSLQGTQGRCTGTTLRDGMRREVGQGFRMGDPWLIHVSAWQKPPQYCKVIGLQFKKNY